MYFLILILISILTMEIVSYMGKRCIKPVLIIKKKRIYQIVSISLIVVIGSIIVLLMDNKEKPYIVGGTLGVVEGMVNCLVVFEE